MYLNKLNENQKGLFLQLVYAAAMANGEYVEQEKAIIETYCREMDTEFDPKDATNDVDAVISVLSSISTDEEKRIIVFEVMGLILADYTYDDAEKGFMGKLSAAFGVDKAYIDKCEMLIDEYLKLQSDINALVL